LNKMPDKRIRIGSGAGYSGDRIEPALDLATRGQLDYLVFECLAERTIALAQLQKSKDPNRGYDPMLEERMRTVLPACIANATKIITNMGAANPMSAMEITASLARDLGLKGLKIAAVTGDDVLSAIRDGDFTLLETGKPMKSLGTSLISANAYLGARPIVEALHQGADVVITGRVADPVLFSAALIYEYGWNMEDYPLLGQGIVLGHLMECAAQVCGGYFADPGYKEVPGLGNLGFPIAEANADGTFLISKLEGSGGLVTAATCKEQLLYEIHNPASYLTPDVIADFTEVVMEEIKKDVVRVSGGTGRPKTGTLKVSVGYTDGYIGEGQISYGGPGAVDRARLAQQIVETRIREGGIEVSEIRFDLIGANSLYGNQISKGEPYEVRLRVAGRCADRAQANAIGNEVETLYTNGPAGGGGVSKVVSEVLAIQSVLIDESRVAAKIHYKSI
jgi:hypothetical protein